MTTTGMELFQMLKPKMGDREAGALVTFVDNTIKNNNKEIHEINLRTLATKEELGKVRDDLSKDIYNVREDLTKEIGNVRVDLARVEGRLETKIAEVKSDVMRWMFAFFVTMMLAILGLYLKK